MSARERARERSQWVDSWEREKARERRFYVVGGTIAAALIAALVLGTIAVVEGWL